MIYWEIFVAFFIPSIVGYGGGPASIPLIQYEVVERYGWVTQERFGEMLAFGNSLPGPIATKMAGYIGYEVGGVAGAVLALVATVGPSLLAMVLLLGLLLRLKHSPRLKRMTAFILPAIAVLLGSMTFDFFQESWGQLGGLETLLLAAVSYVLLEKFKWQPAFVILCALGYGVLSVML